MITGEKKNGKHCRIIAVSIKGAEYEIFDICPYKGRLAGKTMKMLESLGITCEEMKEKDSRKLIFTNEELKLKFFLAKGRTYRHM